MKNIFRNPLLAKHRIIIFLVFLATLVILTGCMQIDDTSVANNGTGNSTSDQNNDQEPTKPDYELTLYNLHQDPGESSDGVIVRKLVKNEIRKKIDPQGRKFRR